MLIQHQILITKCQGNLYQLERELSIRSWGLRVNWKMDVIERNLFDTCQHFCNPGVLQEGFYQHI